MYTVFFGLEKKPFVLTPDPEFFFFSKGHDLAFTHLEYGLMHNVGFIALTGDVGTGKTTLLKYLFNRVSSSLNIGMIFNTQVNPHSFLEMLVKEFELCPASNRKSDLYSSLYEHFLKKGIASGFTWPTAARGASAKATMAEIRNRIVLFNLKLSSNFAVCIAKPELPQTEATTLVSP